MTSLDQAMKKAFQRREQPAAESGQVTSATGFTPAAIATAAPTPVAGDRELFVDAPEKRLRGAHRPPDRPPSLAAARQAAGAASAVPPHIDPPRERPSHANASVPETPQPAEPTDSFGSVMSSLLSYELSVAGPLTDTWPLDDVLPVLERGSVPVPSEHHKRHVLPRSVAHPPFKPAWETDSFRLPPVCRTIQTRLQVPLHLATAEMLEVLHEARPVISVVSTRRGAGATTVSLVLAHSLVKAGRNVALVDADLGAVRSLADQLGVAVDGGWNSALALGIDATECTVQSLADGFCIVPLERSDQPGHSSGDGQVPLTALLRRTVGSFDVVVVDCGNDAATLDAAALDLECIRILVKDMRTGDAVTGGRIARAHGRVHIVENFAPVSTH